MSPRVRLLNLAAFYARLGRHYLAQRVLEAAWAIDTSRN